MSNGLTTAQNKVFKFIVRSIASNGMPPTRAEIISYFGWRSPNAAEDHLKAIERKGAIQLIPGTARGIRIRAPKDCPHCGQELP